MFSISNIKPAYWLVRTVRYGMPKLQEVCVVHKLYLRLEGFVIFIFLCVLIMNIMPANWLVQTVHYGIQKLQEVCVVHESNFHSGGFVIFIFLCVLILNIKPAYLLMRTVLYDRQRPYDLRITEIFIVLYWYTVKLPCKKFLLLDLNSTHAC